MDTRTLLRNAGYDVTHLTSTEYSMLSNAICAAHSAGYISGYSAAVTAIPNDGRVFI